MFSFLGWGGGAKSADSQQQKKEPARDARLQQLGIDPSIFHDIPEDDIADLAPPAAPPEGILQKTSPQCIRTSTDNRIPSFLQIT